MSKSIYRNVHYRRDLRLGAAVAALLMTGGIAHAEDVADAAPAAESAGVDIMVTANRRDESLHDVPVSASVMSMEAVSALSASGQDMKALAFKVPSLNIESSNGRVFPRLYIRGYGNTDFTSFASQPVSIVYDDVVQENPNLKGFPIFDLENVEVLRGPQGTLFGRNAPAGVVSFRSAKPVIGETSGYATASLGTYMSANLEGAVNIPLGDAFALRVSAQRQSRNDWVDDPILDTSYEGYSDLAGRIQLLYDAGTDFTALFNVHGRTLTGNNTLFRANIIEPGSNRFAAGFERSKIYIDADSNQRLRSGGASARLNWDMGSFSLFSITGYEQVFKYYSLGDVDGGYGAVFAPPSGPGLIPFPVATASDVHNVGQFTQELRIASDPSSKIDWQAGVYFFRETVSASSPAFDGTGTVVANNSRARQRNNAAAIFGSVAYPVTDALKVRAGLRYTYDHKTFRITDIYNLVLDPTSAKASASNLSWDLSATYEVNPDLNLYGRVATGFRAPSFGAASAANGLQVAGSEKNTSFEAGFKSFLFDRKASLNLGLYYFRLKDQQLSAIGGATNATLLLNADRTDGYGLEFDFSARPTDNLTLSASGSYNFTKIKDSTLTNGVCAMCTVTDPLDANGNALVNGNPLPQAARYVLNGSVRYELPVGPGKLFAQSDLSWRSKVNFFLYTSTEFTGRPFADLGLRGGYKWGDGAYEVAAFCRNCLDQTRVISGIDFNNLTGVINEPRIIGGQFTVRY